jgi:hypothetical protein
MLELDESKQLKVSLILTYYLQRRCDARTPDGDSLNQRRSRVAFVDLRLGDDGQLDLVTPHAAALALL